MSQQPFKSDGGFNTTGNITVGNILIAGTIEPSDLASPAPSLNGFLNIDAIGNITAGNFVGAGSNVDIVAGSYDWTFVNDGNLVLPGNTFAVKYANGTAVSLGGSSYGNANVADFLDSLGSNAIVTTGNITGGNLIATANVLGNGYARLTGTFDESQASTAGLYLGYAGGTPRMMFGTGNTLQTFEIDNDSGTLRFYQPGSTKMSLSSAGNLSVTGNVTAQNFIGNISITGNVTGTSPNVSLVAGSYTYTFDNTGILTLPAPASGNEGGELAFTQAGNSTLAGNTVVMDQYVDRIRFFESGGNTRGAYIDLTQAADGVGTLLNNRVSGIVNAGTFVTMDLLKATVTTSGNRGLSLAATTGSFNINISGTYGGIGGGSGSAATGTINTTPSTSQFGWNFTAQAEGSTYIITDTTNNRAYRVTLQIGGSFNNNLISIERLI